MSDLEERIRRVEDRPDLRELVVRYTLAVDEHDMEALGTLFAPDGGFGRAGNPAGVVRGRDEVVATLGRLLGQVGPSFHVVHDQVISFDESGPGKAAGVVNCHAETSGATQYVAAIRYHDTYARHDGGGRSRNGFCTFSISYRPKSREPSCGRNSECVTRRNRRAPTDRPSPNAPTQLWAYQS